VQPHSKVFARNQFFQEQFTMLQPHGAIAPRKEVFPPQEAHAESAWRRPCARQMYSCNETAMNLK
jgi:hypothetical protein